MLRPNDGALPLWAVGLSVVNSAGVLPAAYLLVGRQPKVSG
ncbi:hypothetical protein [Jongsikchunia kroppenstedtii]|nr:hypothetical protein [Jongsikchunia kroppenstedtii]